MANIFEFGDYKSFINLWISNKGKAGRGEFRRISKALHIHPTLVSHIFRGDKELSMEQASLLCRYLELDSFETDFLLLLVQRAKSGSVELSKILDRQITQYQNRAKSLVNRVTSNMKLTEEDKAIFYSNWYYSGIRLLTSI